MSEKLLLISGAKSGVLLRQRERKSIWFVLMVALGLLVLIVGAADLSTRIAHRYLGSNAGAISFAPAAAILGSQSPASALVATTSATIAGAIVPVRLRIPAIGVDAKVEHVGKKSDGSMATPSTFNNVAWYSPGSLPGAPGNAVIDGHVNNALTTAGVFQHLASLTLGDMVEVSDVNGKTLSYKVTQVQEYPADTAPARTIFATTGPSQLVLITCDGDWVESQHSFNKRLVVFAEQL